jgi:uncharacterized protein
MPRVVVDTTVLISAFLTEEGVAAEVLGLGRAGVFALCLSQAILEELRSRLLHRRRIRRRYQYTDARVHEHCRDLEAAAQIIASIPPVRVVERDPNDDMVVACALAGGADYVVTRDKDLLSLGAYEGIRMVTPRQLLDLLAGSGRG